MILALALFCFVAMLIAFYASVQYGILVAFLTKPMIDASWDTHIGFGLNVLRLVGVLFPLLVFFRSLGTGKPFTQIPLATIWIVYVAYNLLVSTVIIFEHDLMSYINRSFRILNAVIGYYMIQTYFADKEAFRKLLIFIILAGIFPLMMGVYQAATGVVWEERQTVGLIRNVGLYHDAAVFRQLSFQTLTGVLLYWTYFLSDDSRVMIKKVLMLGLMVAAAAVLFKTYSKAGYLILGMWVIIWSVGRRKFMPMVIVLVALVVVNIAYKDQIWSETQLLFSKEIAAAQDGTEREKKMSLAGRWYHWEEIIDYYYEQSVIRQIFGGNRSLSAHNDYLEQLITGGVVGLLIYIVLLTLIGMKVYGNYRREKSPLNVMALMIFAMWMIDTIGLVPTQFPAYQWYVWGIIGLSFKGVDWGDEKPPLLDGSSARPRDNILARKKRI